MQTTEAPPTTSADQLLDVAFVNLPSRSRAVLDLARSFVLPALKMGVVIKGVKGAETSACIWSVRLAEKLVFAVMPEETRDAVIAARTTGGKPTDFSKLDDSEGGVA